MYDSLKIKDNYNQEREKALQLGLQFLELDGFIPDISALRLVPRHAAARFSLIPLALNNLNDNEETLLVATSDPENPRIYNELLAKNRRIVFIVAASDDINKNLDKIYDFYRNVNNGAPVNYIVDFFIEQAVRSNASDIHIEVETENKNKFENKINDINAAFVRVRFRIDGKLYAKFKYSAVLHPPIVNVFKIKSGMNISENRLPQDGRFIIDIDGRSIDMRVNTLPSVKGEKIAVRILDSGNSFVKLDKLGFDEDDMKIINDFCAAPHGIVLATGPTGSGKSTTLYSILQTVNRPEINIITIEDPVEFMIDGINQVQVNEKIGLTFDAALRASLRQDPDKIMVGEIRDSDTARTAIRASLTGHFVISTLHTNDAPEAATRLVEMGIPQFLVASALYGVIAQRLVRRLCPECRYEYELDAHICENLNLPFGTKAFKASGCDKCNYTGYKGRTGIFEIMRIDDEIRRMILNNISSLELRDVAIKKGMRTLRQSGIKAALKGITSLEEVFNATV